MRIRPRTWLIVAVLVNWAVWGTMTLLSGGEALMGGITEAGEYLIRRQPQSAGVAVSEAFWLFSLAYSSLTLIGTPFVLAGMFTAGRPSWDRGVMDALVWIACCSWGLMAAILAFARLAEWFDP